MRPIYFDWHTRAIADLHEVDDYWRIARINVPEKHRRKGIGTRLLQRVLQDADAEGILLFLEPLSTARDFPQSALVAWYQRHGFERADYNILYRQPLGFTVPWALPSIYDFLQR